MFDWFKIRLMTLQIPSSSIVGLIKWLILDIEMFIGELTLILD